MPQHKSTKVAVITGCSSGIGRRLVKEALKHGWKVYATMRDAEQRPEVFQEEIEEYPNHLTVATLDVTKPEERQMFVKRFLEHEASLDALINNAGVGLFGPFEGFSEQSIRQVHETNFLGAALFTQSLLPMIRQSQGKIIVVSSSAGISGFPLSSIYSASKFALEGWAEALFHELKPQLVKVHVVEPGLLRTAFLTNAQWSQPETANLSPIYGVQMKNLKRLHYQMMATQDFPGAERAAKAILRLMSSDTSQFRVRVGKDAKFVWIVRKLFPFRLAALFYQQLFKRTLLQSEKISRS